VGKEATVDEDVMSDLNAVEAAANQQGRRADRCFVEYT
jgi:hypothetical protein